MRIPKTSIRTTWRTDWLVEFSIALVALAFLTRESILAVVGAGILLSLVSFALLFHQRLGILGRELDVVERLPRARVVLGDTVEGGLSIRNRSRFVARIVAVTLIVEKGLSFRPSSFSRRLLRPGGALSSKFEIISQESGRFQISGLAVTFGDTRDLYVGEVKYAQTVWMEVFPGMRTRLPLTPLRIYGGSPEILRRIPAGIDYADIREYVPGDEYHRVEWKATARLRRLMVKEFHPETQTTLQILIDAGRTMRQQSYVGTKLDEAFAVADLLVESTVGSGNRIAISVYDEVHVLRTIGPAAIQEQRTSLRELSLSLGAHVARGPQSVITRSLRLRRPVSDQSHDRPLTAFLRSLELALGLGYRKTGAYKSLVEAMRADSGCLIILTDLETNSNPLLKAVTTQQRLVRVFVGQIGAAWRLNPNLEEAYALYQKNRRDLQQLQRSGLIVFDVRPERFVETVTKYRRESGK